MDPIIIFATIWGLGWGFFTIGLGLSGYFDTLRWRHDRVSPFDINEK